MPSYKAPVRDIQFVLNEVCDINTVCQQIPDYHHISHDLIDTIILEAAKITENVIFPLNQSGDQEGLQFHNHEVKTPKGFKEAYQQFVEGGWMSLNADPKFGGQGLPKMLQVALDEMLSSSNVSFSLYTKLTQGAYQALSLHANEYLQKTYLEHLVSGHWSGTMCLTESHCGTDLGLIRTKAESQNDGSYKLSGTKIFITSGEHDLADNIIHIVLARLPDAAEGIKGISLFLVPKFFVNNDGSLGARNKVFCGSIEHKMGIKASATCVMNFDDATGFLVGEKHQGMKAMFSMMNLERLNIGLEGLGLSEVSYQNALIYAKERLQGRAATGAKFPEKPADPIIVHPDVRRMLLTMKAFNEGARALALWTALQIDLSKHHPDAKQKQHAENYIALMTPVIKAFFTDYGFDMCNLGLQVFGGHGYIREWGMEQFVRDVRIAQIYEGTNGVQALDLMKRKLLGNKGEFIKQCDEEISLFISHHSQKVNQEFIQPLQQSLNSLKATSQWILDHSDKNPDLANSICVDYLHLLGLTLFAYMWAKMAIAAIPKQSDSFYQHKIATARFFFKKMLPKISQHESAIYAGSDVLMDIEL